MARKKLDQVDKLLQRLKKNREEQGTDAEPVTDVPVGGTTSPRESGGGARGQAPKTHGFSRATPTQKANLSLGPESRRKYNTIQESTQAVRAVNLRTARISTQFSRDIGPYPLDIDWKRRLECKYSLKRFCELYLPDTFNKPWSTDQIYCVEAAQRVCQGGGKFALTMPRGGGKTAICRAASLWATLYAHKHFIFNVGATEPKATGTLGAVRTHLAYNPTIQQDFPEICWPIIHLQGSNRTAASQLFLGEPTYVHMGTDEIRYPTLLLPKEYRDHYQENDPTSIRHVKHLDAWIPSNSVVLLRCAGITASVRGEAETHPVTLEQPRPDLVLLDDVQKDATADSPTLCEKMIRLVDGAVTGLAGPGQHIDALMPCTVIREADVADTYTDPLKKPEWQGRKFKMVNSWPDGITDYEITNDTEAGKHWNHYAELRRTSLRDLGHWQPATDYYLSQREVMDAGFEVSWEDRYDTRINPNTNKPYEESAKQHAMNLRLQLGVVFLSEYQNIGRQLIDAAPVLITADQLMVKLNSTRRYEVDPTHQYVVTFLDVQDEILFYASLSFDDDFNGTFIDYGTWPELTTSYFTKSQTASWSMITTEFFKQHPEHKRKAIKNSQGKIRAPFEAKVYFALQNAIPWILAKQYIRIGEHRKVMPINYLGIDTRWGQATEVVKRYIRESSIEKLIPCYGQPLPPTNKQLEEYERRPGWKFENQRHINVRNPKWVQRPAPDGTWYLMNDVNRLKDFLFQRLATPLGASGSINLYQAPKEQHELFAHHLCSSEYPEPVTARGVTKNMWAVREGIGFDNDFLDCSAGCMALASLAGASIKTSDYEFVPETRSLARLAAEKQRLRNERRTSEALRNKEPVR